MSNATRTKKQMTPEDCLLERMMEGTATDRREEERGGSEDRRPTKMMENIAVDNMTEEKNLACEDRLLAKMMEDEAVDRAAAYLSQIREMNYLIEQKIQFQGQLRDLANRTTGEWLPLPGGGRRDSRSAAMDRWIDLEKEINADIDHLWDLKNEIWQVLRQIKDRRIAGILNDLYLLGRSVDQVADRNDFCRRYTNRLKREGLLEVDRILREVQPMQGCVSPLR